VLGNDTDVDGGALQAVLVSGPSHGTLTLNTDGSFNYLPAANFAGADSFSYHANDGSGDSSPVIVSIVVNAVNDAPAANNQSVTTQENRAVSITLQAQDAEGDPLTYRIVSGPANGTLTGVAPNMSYTPRNNFIGADSFTFVANDGVVDSNVATVGITVTSPTNQPPVANSQSVQTDEDTRVRIRLTAEDAEGKSLKFLVVSGPQHGRLTGHAPNLRYRPDSDYNGPDSFTFKVSDGTSESNIATVSITVRPVNDAPEAEDVVVRKTGSGPVSGLMRATDADGDTLRFRVVGEPVRGTVTVDAATGGFVYTPPPGAKRSDVRFSYVANDGTIDSQRATVKID
jgi:VCBS repeat-containing protein